MWYIFGSSLTIKRVRKFLKQMGVEYEDTKSDEYLYVRENPISILPPSLRRKVKVEKIPDDDPYFFLLKHYGELSFLFQKEEKPKPEAGSVVRIVGGDYKDMNLKGIVTEVREKTCSVEVSLWGRIVKLNLPFEHVEKVVEEEF
jgi:transcription antitermination factor NusG